MPRLTDNDRTFGPITFGRYKWKALRLAWSSGHDEGHHGNSIDFHGFGWSARIRLPDIIRPFRVKHTATTWDKATIERIGRDYYHVESPRKFGFCLCDGHLSVYHGAQTNDSDTTKTWSCFLPWTQWRFVRISFYDRSGNHFWTALEKDNWRKRKAGADSFGLFKQQMDMRDSCPSVSFEFDDFDGKRITAKTMIEEREWAFGEGWFKWLSWFRRNKARRALDIRFSEEVGPEKGSWKGGTLGHGIDMLPGELHEQSFRRYCDMEHEQKRRRFKLKFIRPIP